jgi:hypothetical protein
MRSRIQARRASTAAPDPGASAQCRVEYSVPHSEHMPGIVAVAGTR